MILIVISHLSADTFFCVCACLLVCFQDIATVDSNLGNSDVLNLRVWTETFLRVSLSWETTADAESKVPPAANQELLKVVSFKPSLSRNIATHASPADRNSLLLTSTLSFHSVFICGVNRKSK